MKRGGRQLPLDFRHLPEMDREAFLEGEGNREALALVDRWPDWPARFVLLIGPEGAGKSHLAAIWQVRSDARPLDAAELGVAIAGGPNPKASILLEDIDTPLRDEAGLFHLLNQCRERNCFVLMTSRTPLPAMGIGLPDLLSRLRAAFTASLGAPDDALLRRVLTKLFADRQLTVEPGVLDYMMRRMERSFAAARGLVDRLDREALAAGRAVTRRLAAEVLEDLGEEE